MSRLSENVIKAIKEQEAKPKPKLLFRMRESGFWLAFALTILAAGVFAALAWYFLSAAEIGPQRYAAWAMISGKGPRFVLIGGLLAFAALCAVFRSTRMGYRVNRYALLAVFVFAIALLSIAFGFMGTDRWADGLLSRLPAYESREAFMLSVWQKPQEGRIAGEITALANKSRFELRDADGKLWTIDASQALWRHGLEPAKGLKLKMLGTSEDSVFKAADIRPWLPPRGFCAMEERAGSCMAGH